MKIIRRDKKTGRMLPQYKEWTLDNFDHGYINIDGRFMVKQTGHHRANVNGWILRNILAYELYNHDIVTIEYDIHHKDGNRLNDSKDNLEKILHREHGLLHNPKGIVRAENKHLRKGKYLICTVCKKEFYRPRWVINHNQSKINFCSNKCRNNRKEYVDYRNGVIYNVL